MTQPIFIYFHGAPGSAQDLDLVPQLGWRNDVDIHVPSRQNTGVLPSDKLYDKVAADIVKTYPNRPIRLIGFSLGGSLALHIALRLGKQVERIDLIAPAAPLELGNFLPDMMGKPVFELAKKSLFLLSLQVKVQGFLARFAPNTLYNMVFSSAVGADETLAKDPAFKAVITGILRATVLTGSQAYVSELCTYVKPWAHILKDVKTPVILWHGSEDNWAPLAMSKALQTALPHGAQLIEMQGLSHYSALIKAMPKIVGLK